MTPLSGLLLMKLLTYINQDLNIPHTNFYLA